METRSMRNYYPRQICRDGGGTRLKKRGFGGRTTVGSQHLNLLVGFLKAYGWLLLETEYWSRKYIDVDFS